MVVTGLKDCHILTFNQSGTVSDHLVLHPQLDAHNFIIKTLWMPGSQTQLALVTADFVKIYDLATDVLSPQYYFLVPSGKVHDCTLAFMPDGRKYVLIMSSAGHIYYQSLCDESLARHGPFYVTNIMDVAHPDLEDSSEQIGGGGVSIFYYHTLQLLFFSYVQGKSFMAPLRQVKDELKDVCKIDIKSRSTVSNKIQPLCQWNEIQSHPGLITAFLQMSNNPVVIMVKPDVVTVQELKVTGVVGSGSQQLAAAAGGSNSASSGNNANSNEGSGASNQASNSNKSTKIIDMVAIRHAVAGSNQDQQQDGSSQLRTTLILLCEDGSLKIYMAAPEKTEFWLNEVAPSAVAPSIAQIKPPRRRRIPKISRPNVGSGERGSASGIGNTSNSGFPVDFFENCSTISDIEFGGNDVLQVKKNAECTLSYVI